MVTNVLPSIMLRRLTRIHESDIGEQQAGFHLRQDCIVQIVILQQIFKMRHLPRRLMLLGFLDLNGTMGSVDRIALSGALHRKRMP